MAALTIPRRRSSQEYESRRLVIVIRLARLIARCRQCRYLPTLPTLAAELGVSTRTVVRDLRALRTAQIPVPPRLYDEQQLW